jgi:hypothetical protein
VAAKEDAATLDTAGRAMLRQEALAWLRADLPAWGELLQKGKAANRKLVEQKLKHWPTDPDLAGLRDAAALAKLPAEEQKVGRKLWADVAALLKKRG